ncbi:DUF806 family protein [Lactococcus lactis]|uniref:DUF806 family protein n=1 Tax=Lactococcus lactis TaxID=1358 RepID=UPI0022E4F8D2|nr:DUF806 family protein [Lactococcus lactis]
MRPTQEVSQIVGDFRPSWLVFENFIPKEHINDLDNTQVLLTEFKSDITNYGDGTFNSVILAVTIQIFYGFNLSESMLIAEIELMEKLKDSGWLTTSSEPHYLDVSTNTTKQ